MNTQKAVVIKNLKSSLWSSRAVSLFFWSTKKSFKAKAHEMGIVKKFHHSSNVNLTVLQMSKFKIIHHPDPLVVQRHPS